jgi:hypothetical protein
MLLQDKARELAAEGVADRLEKMNEFREQLDRQAATFVVKTELEARFDRAIEAVRLAEASVALRSGRQDDRIDALEKFKDNYEGRFWALGAALVVFVGLLEFLLRYLQTKPL